MRRKAVPNDCIEQSSRGINWQAENQTSVAMRDAVRTAALSYNEHKIACIVTVFPWGVKQIASKIEAFCDFTACIFDWELCLREYRHFPAGRKAVHCGRASTSGEEGKSFATFEHPSATFLGQSAYAVETL